MHALSGRERPVVHRAADARHVDVFASGVPIEDVLAVSAAMLPMGAWESRS